ncbi:gamma-glutamyl-gamma-aminobutyrate hydrolase family protein [Heliorestis acidaminivorans]|uniref:Gamma-glutamyl-gamma-aminobutyrate hydrolase family protein n=1 Tax=Heliorestis acidaminivorans TaxID=553427 RepID=A0A6I0EPI7_9FIRM|nr:gamma-glutamyl-gamma-aminobutyrate hydrolase family protein [Heliorestis acidaminivorans]KAB2951838.1 gamma-glutamyl-gamma-aminobutyrate hydrolase family protein [Heliorestis acidaminivorans]
MKPLVLVTPSFERGRLMVRREYLQALQDEGVLPWPISIEAIEEAEAYCNNAHGLLLSGGGDIDPLFYHQQPHVALGEVDPDRDRLDFAILARALQRQMPILAICRGLQVLNVARGGTLIQDLPRQRPQALRHQQRAPRWHKSHSIDICEGTMLRQIYRNSTGQVNSFHHQAVDRVGKDLEVVARSNDGVIEALEGLGKNFVMAVQWHPEDLYNNDLEARGLFRAFAESCIEYEKICRVTGGCSSEQTNPCDPD